MNLPWETHRDELKNLWLGQNMKLDDLKKYMLEKYNFTATQAQYELQLKKWGFRKNLNDDEWRFIHHRIEKRKAKGKESEVYLNGYQVPAKKLKKELHRRFSPTSQDLSSADGPETPEGLVVCSPRTSVSEQEELLANIPWLQFHETLHALVPTHINSEITTRVVPCSPMSPMSANPTSHSCGVTPGVTIGQSPTKDYPLIQEVTTASIDSLKSIFDHWMQSTDSIIPRLYLDLRAVTLKWASEEILPNIDNLLGPPNIHTFLRLLTFAIYLATNNMLSQDQSDDLRQWFKENHMLPILSSLLQMRKMPTFEAFETEFCSRTVSHPDCIPLAFEADVSASATAGMTPLQRAVRTGNVAEIKQMWEAPTGSNTPREDTVVLGIAVELGNIDLLQFLLDLGARPDISNTEMSYLYTTSPLQEAAINNNVRIFQSLLDHQANANVPTDFYHGQTALQAGFGSENEHIVSRLLEAGACVNREAAYRGMTPLQLAVYHLNFEMVELLLRHKADINSYGSFGTSLQIAAFHGYPEMVRFLLNSEAKGDISEGTYWGALTDAVMCRNTEIIELLKSKVHGIVTPKWPSLIQDLSLVPPERMEVAQFLLDTQHFDESDGPRNALRSAANRNDMEMVRLFLSAGFEANVRGWGFGGRTALQAAVAQGPLDMVNILLEAGADVNARPARRFGVTALQAAAIRGHMEIILTLLNESADINAPGAEEGGRTAIVGAAEHGRLDAVQLLLNAGAKRDKSSCERAAKLAAKNSHYTIAKLLRELDIKE